MNNEYSPHPRQRHLHYHGECGFTNFDDRNVNGIADGNDSDLLWDDDIDEIPIPTVPNQRSHVLSPSSSSSLSSADGNNEEDLEENRSHCSNQEWLLDDDDCEDEKNCHENSSSSSSHSSSNRSTSSDEKSSTLEELSVVEKIEDFILQTVIEPLSEEPNPSGPEFDVQVDSIGFKRKLSFHNLSQARSLTSIILVASFCHDLLTPSPINGDGSEDEGAEDDIDDILHRHGRHRRQRHVPFQRTTTTREVYYFYVTYFRDQRECDKAIWDLVRILDLPSRQSLGLVASPRGWFCGSIDVYNAHTNKLKFNGRELDAHGMAITPSTYDNPYYDGIHPAGDKEIDRQSSNQIRIESDARCILVIEKEGIYTRLSEDKFFLRYLPCILVTGKGFPDIATRRWVWRMQRTLKIPVYGLCDCNPYGVSVLETYQHPQGVKLSANNNNRNQTKKNRKRKVHAEEEDCLEMNWIGLCPSQVETMDLPPEVFQELTSNDRKRLDSLLAPKPSGSKPFAERGRNKAERLQELRAMRRYKVELEALHWKGANYLSRFVYETIMTLESQHASKGHKFKQTSPQHHAGFDTSDSSASDDNNDAISETRNRRNDRNIC